MWIGDVGGLAWEWQLNQNYVFLPWYACCHTPLNVSYTAANENGQWAHSAASQYPSYNLWQQLTLAQGAGWLTTYLMVSLQEKGGKNTHKMLGSHGNNTAMATRMQCKNSLVTIITCCHGNHSRQSSAWQPGGSPWLRMAALSPTSSANSPSMEEMAALYCWMRDLKDFTCLSRSDLLHSSVEGSWSSLWHSPIHCTQRTHTRYGLCLLHHPHHTTATLITHLLPPLYRPLLPCLVLWGVRERRWGSHDDSHTNGSHLTHISISQTHTRSATPSKLGQQ